MPVPSERVVLAAFLAVFICRAAAGMLILPPWQGMDEPQHLSLSYQFARGDGAIVEADILRSMAANHFWKQWEDPAPYPLPARIGDVLGPGTLAQPTYYAVASSLLAVTRSERVVDALYHLRFLSVVLTTAALVFAWLGLRLLFGSDIALGAIAIASLHPQYLLVAITANPDALLLPIAAFIWWQLARIVAGIRRDYSLMLVIVAAVAASLTKRSGIVIAISSTLAAAAMMRDGWRMTPRRVGVAVGIAALAVAPLLAAWWFLPERLQALVSFWQLPFSVRRSAEDATIGEAGSYVMMAADHLWLVAGWVRFSPPEWWLWIARTLLVGGIVGVAFTLARERGSRLPVLLAGFLLSVHVAAMLFTVFWSVQTAPEARFLFPAYAPLIALACVGLSRLVEVPLRRRWYITVLTLFALLDVTAFSHVLIPIYLTW